MFAADTGTILMVSYTAKQTLKERKVIKIIKRKAAAIQDSPPAASPPEQTVTETVTDWIETSRKNRLDQENSSREKIAGWAAETE